MPRPSSLTASIRRPTLGMARMASPSTPACTTGWAEIRRSMAPPCSGYASGISARLQHTDGILPDWPLGYDVFEPYYGQAEALFHVHGQRGEDPNEPWSSTPYAYPSVSHEPRIQALNDSLVKGRPASFPSAARHPDGREGRQSHPGRAPASAATPSTAFPAPSTPRQMRR